MKRKFTFLTAAFMLLAFLAVPLGMRGQVVSGTTYNTTSSSDFPTGWSYDGEFTTGNTPYLKLVASSNYIQTSDFAQNGFTSIVLKARKFGGPSNEEALITVSWYNDNTETVLGTITPTSTNLSNYTISSPNNPTGNTTGYIKIQCKGASGSKGSGVSAVTITYTAGGSTPPTPTYTVTYNANGGTGTMTDPGSPYEENDEVTLLTNDFTAPEGKMWDSWSVKDANNQTITVTNGKFNMPASDVTVTAQWVTDPNATQYEWVETSLSSLVSTDIFVIVGNNGSDYALSSANGTSSAPPVYAVTIADGKINTNATPVTEALKFNISGDATNGYTFYSNGSTTNYIYCTNTNNGVRVGKPNSNTTEEHSFTVTNGYLTVGFSTPRYIGIYNSSDWRCYTDYTGNNIANQTFKYYKRQVASNDPVISATDPEILPYNATGGEFGYSIANPTGATLSATSNSDWITSVTVDGTNSKVTFNTSTNNTNTQRQGTITLSYNGASDKVVTITQAAAPVIYTTISEIFSAATANGSTASNVNVTFGNWVVSGVSGSNAFVTDNNGNGFIIYTSNHGFVVNDKLSGTVMGTPLKLYNGSAEFTNLTDATDGLSTSTDGTITVITNKTIADLGGVNTGAVITLSNLTYDGTNLSDGTNTIKPYNTLFNSMSFSNGKTYNVTGVYQQYTTNNSDTKEILPRSAADIEEVTVTTPSITVANATVEVPVNGGDGTMDITYENLTITDEDDFAIQFYNAQGAELNGNAAPDWIEAEVFEDGGGYVVYYTVKANEGPAHTAYFKVFAMGDTDLVYSNLVTVSQAAYVIPSAISWELTDLADLTNSDIFVIVGTVSDGTFALPSESVSSQGAPSAMAVTVAGGTLSEEPAAELQWNLEGNATDGYTFYVNGDHDKYLYCNTNASSGSNNNIRVVVTGNIHRNVFTLDDNNYLVTNDSNEDRYLSIYVNGGDWRSYVNTGNNPAVISFYKKVVVATPTQSTLSITGYGSSEGGYKLIASPVTVDPSTVGMTTGTYDLYRFDQSQDKEWLNYKKTPFYLIPGKGYLYAHSTDGSFTLSGVAYDGNGEVGLTFTSGNQHQFAGWNLIGNPFTSTAYLADSRDFYRMNTAGDRLIINTDAEGGGNDIAVCEGIFVLATAANQSVTFTTTDPSLSPSPGNNNGMVNISVAQIVNSRDAQPSADYARIRINNGENMSKFVFNENTSRVYIPQGNKDYAVVRSEARGEMPVNFKAAENGTYTIDVEAENLEVNYLHLIDNLTGMDVDLLATPSYTFEARKSDIASRFRLVFDANTGNDETNDNFAFINNGELIVNGNGTVQVIDILGRQMFSHEVNSSFRIQNSEFAPGVYVLRLVNGNNVKTQKIVIK